MEYKLKYDRQNPLNLMFEQNKKKKKIVFFCVVHTNKHSKLNQLNTIFNKLSDFNIWITYVCLVIGTVIYS